MEPVLTTGDLALADDDPRTIVPPRAPAGDSDDDLDVLSDPESDTNEADVAVLIIEPKTGWRLVDWQELWHYRDLYFFLVWRGVKVRYAQSAIGIGWAVIQPVFSMLMFSVVFGRLAKIDSEGAPYAVFSFAALVPWTYFSNALTDGASSLISNANMISKVYFPRLILPFAAVAAKLVDFTIAMVILALLMIWYGIVPTAGALALPLLIVLMMLTAAGLGAWITALAVQYRDVQHAMSFVVQLLMYAAPVVYPTSLIPERYELLGRTVNLQLLYSLNPMVGVIEGFRAALLGTRSMPWDFIAIGSASAVIIAVTGILYFRRREHLFADVA
jgi:lipopolysaccharide transport system permease protein